MPLATRIASSSESAPSPAVPTGGAAGLQLRYQRWLSLAAGDTVRVLVNGVQVWTNTGGVQDSAWQPITHDISAITNGQTTATIRFELSTNATNVAGGWSIDDVQLFSASDEAPPLFYGNATAGTGSVLPVIALPSSARIGGTANIAASNLLGGANCFLFLNLFPDNLPILGMDLLVSPLGALTSPQAATGGGSAAWPLAIPNAPALDNIYLYTQALVLDAGSPGGVFAATRGMRFRTHLN